jgi:hypothetical protein
MPAVTTENEFQHGLRSLEKEAAPGARRFVPRLAVQVF